MCIFRALKPCAGGTVDDDPRDAVPVHASDVIRQRLRGAAQQHRLQQRVHGGALPREHARLLHRHRRHASLRRRHGLGAA